MMENGQRYWYINDHLGTPQKLLDQSGAVVWSAVYGAYGEAAVWAGSSVENNLRFPGQYYDEETGLHYNWHRYYDPQTGRYLTPDPIGLKGGMNLFLYADANPINETDPLGLYGTNSCSYYEKRCEETGVDYYCKTAPKYCNKFPKYPDPDPSKDDDYEGWARCTRQCLQDCDAENAPNTCNDDVDEFWDKVNFQCHVKCYTECGAGKFTGDNPY